MVDRVHYPKPPKKMIIPKDFYEKCDPTYQKEVLDKLEAVLAEHPVNSREPMCDKKCVACHASCDIPSFSSKYMIPKKYWDYLFNLSYFSNRYWWRHRTAFMTLEHSAHILKQAEKCFYYNKDTYFLPNYEFKKPWRLLHYNSPYDEESMKVEEADLKYPHAFLEDFFQELKKHSSSPISPMLAKKAEEMKILYQKLKVEKDIEKWFYLVIEADNIEFIRENVEYQLGQNLLQKRLWKSYINYLKNKDPKYMLVIYSKYCRFFLDDVKMKENYESDWAKYGPSKEVQEIWGGYHLFDFEKAEDKNSVSEEDSADKKEKAAAVSPLDKSLFLNFYKTYLSQEFPLRDVTLDYILQKANHLLLRKLFSSCKYFYHKKQTPICYNLTSKRNYNNMESFYHLEKLQLNACDDEKMFLKNTHITTTINVYPPQNDSEGQFLMSKIISRLSRCDAKYITLHCQCLKFKELEFLIGHGGIVELSIFHGELRDDQYKYIDLEKITEFLPNIQKLQLSMVQFTEDTPFALTRQKFNSKIFKFSVTKAIIAGKMFDVEQFLEFCDENRAENFELFFRFHKRSNVDFFTRCKDAMEKYEKKSEKKTKVCVKFFGN